MTPLTKKVKAEYLSSNIIICPLTSNKAYSIAVSNNGKSLSEGRLLAVSYHSRCLICNTDRTGIYCGTTNEGCYIDGECHQNGTVYSRNECLVCRSDLSSTRWSEITDGNCATYAISLNTIIITFVVILVLVMVIAIVIAVKLVKQRTAEKKLLEEIENNRRSNDHDITLPPGVRIGTYGATRRLKF